MIGANQETNDNLTPVYNSINENVLPGLSAFIDTLVEKNSTDSSDHWFTSRARCAYLSWALKINQKIRLNQDQHNDIRLNPEDKDHQESTITKYCSDWPDITDQELPDLSNLKLSLLKPPGFPIERFIAAQEAYFSPLSSFVQKTPSYEATIMIGDASSNMHKKRIILETVLFLLGGITKGAPDDSWSKHYTSNFKLAMHPFHCSHAHSLTDIALGQFSPAGYSQDSFDAYGYQPGFAFAGGYEVSSQQRKKYMTSIVEVLVLAFLMKRVGG